MEADKFTINRNNLHGHLLRVMINGVMEVVPLNITPVDYSEGKSNSAKDICSILVEDLDILHLSEEQMHVSIIIVELKNCFWKL